MKKGSSIILSALFGIILFLQFCGPNNYEVFEQKVQKFSVDNTISVEEWDELTAAIELHSGDRAFYRFLTNGVLDQQKLRKFLENRGYWIESKTPDTPKTVNIYIENSGSMFGFVNGNTGFKNALTKLVVDLKSNGYPAESMSFHFINKQITPLTIYGDIEYFPKTLSNIGDKDSGDSDINEIFRQILENTSSASISILVSDCVYSVGRDVKNNDVDGALKIQKSLTEGVFRNVINDKGLSVIFTQLVSDFNGTYYTKDNYKIPLNGQHIPYYITVIGSETDLPKFDFVEGLDGYQNKLVLTIQDYSQNTFYSLFQTTEDNGEYKPIRTRNSNPNIVQSIENIRFRGRGGETFVFSLAVDFSKLPVSERYLAEESNYIIEKGDYEIASILPFDRNMVKPNALKKLDQTNITPTHILVFESTSNKYNDLVFALKKDVPEWIYTWNTNDDSDIRTNPKQTFGLKYFVEGIFEAYQNSSYNKDYITFTINIKK